MTNYDPVRDPVGAQVLRAKMKKEVCEGRMLGGPGWTAETVRNFFGGNNFWGIPCGAVEKNEDPLGRIIHDYGYYPRDSYSVNAAHSSTSVKYLSFKERTALLENIC